MKKYLIIIFSDLDGTILHRSNFKFDKIKKMKYSAYMKKMRDEMDKELFDYPVKKGVNDTYPRKCIAQKDNQPIVLTKEQLDRDLGS